MCKPQSHLWADNRSMHHKVQGRGRGWGDCHKRFTIGCTSPPRQQNGQTPKALMQTKFGIQSIFKRKASKKIKKKERKNVQDTPLEPLLMNVSIFYLISDCSSMKHEVA